MQANQTLRLCSAVVALAACKTQPEVINMPLFERVVIPVLDSIPGSSSVSSVAVNPNGAVAVLGPEVIASAALVIIGQDGGITRTIAKGSGPGQLSGYGRLFSGRGEFTIADTVNQRLVRVDGSGVVIAELPLVRDALVLGVIADSIDILPLTAGGYSGLLRVSMVDGGAQVLLPSSETFLAEWLSRHGPTAYARPRLPYGTNGEQAVIGDAYSYRVMRFGRGLGDRSIVGRDLPPRHRTAAEYRRFAERLRKFATSGYDSLAMEQEIESTRAQILPHFGLYGLWIIDAGFTLVVGDASDSTFVDMFDDTVHRGRVMLDCPSYDGNVGVGGEWLLLACRDRGPGGPDGVSFRLYRMMTH